MKILFTLTICTFALQMAIAQEEPPPVEAISAIVNDVLPAELKSSHRMPEFPGGTKALLAFIDSTIQYPIDLQYIIEGKVIVQFVIWEDGCLDSFKIIRTPHPLLGEEALRVPKLMPKWIPATQAGRKVAVWFTLLVAFKLK